MILKSIKSTFPSPLKSLEGGGEGRLYQYAAIEKSMRLTRPSLFKSLFVGVFVGVIGAARTFLVPTIKPMALLKEVISPFDVVFDFVKC